jgi:DNA invertase Pin-like site-specific DNA recombinase
MLGVFAEFERGIIQERVKAELARARQYGTKLGRRRVKPSVEATIRELRAKGDGILKIAKTLGVGTGGSSWKQSETGAFGWRRAAI